MNWIPEYHIVTFLRAERLHRAQKPGRVLDLQRLYKWLSTWRAKLAARGQIHPRIAHAQE